MRLLLNSRQKVVGFWLVITVEGCSLSPERTLLGDNGGAHGPTPMKPYTDKLKKVQLWLLTSLVKYIEKVQLVGH